MNTLLQKNTLELVVSGKKHSGWKKVTISKSMDAISGKFEFETTSTFYRDGSIETIDVGEGDACQVRLNGKTVINGYVDDVVPSYNADSDSVKISGRDKTCDLVDCSAINEPSEWNNSSLAKIVRDIVSPFGFNISTTPALTKIIKKFSLNPSETAFEAIDRLCRQFAILPRFDGQSAISLVPAAIITSQTALTEGVNIKDASAHYSLAGRHSRYIVKGQCAGSDDTYGASCNFKAEATDENVKRYRPLMIIASGQTSTDFAKKTAIWEATVRSARAKYFTVTTQGWEQNNGELWDLNLLVPVTSKRLRLDNDILLVTDISYTEDEDSGTNTQMTLKKRDAYTPPPEQKIKKEKTAVWNQ